MLDKFEVTLPSLTWDEPRFAYVYCPDKPGKYPVLYMFDGHNVFFDEDATYGKSWGMLEFLEEKKQSGAIRQIGFSYHGTAGDLFAERFEAWEDRPTGRRPKRTASLTKKRHAQTRYIIPYHPGLPA